MLRPLLFVSVALTAFSPAFSADDDEDIIIVTGLRPLPPEEVTASVTVIDKDELSVRDTPYIADQLRAVPGLGISRSGTSGGLTQVRVRGAEANHTLVLLNGIEISDPVTGETDFGLWSGLNADRIEILRGEQSALYGSDAIGGVVNIVSGRAEGTSGLLEAGSDDTWRLNAQHGIQGETGGVDFAVSAFETAGVDTSGSGGERDGSESWSALVTGQADLNNAWSFSGLLRYSGDETDTDADSDFDGLLEDTDRVTKSDQLTIGGMLQGETDGLSHHLRASYARVVRENNADGLFVDETTGERFKIGYSPSKSFSHQAADVTLSGLIDYEKEEYERVSVDTFFGDPNQSQSFETVGVAAEAQVVQNNLTFSGSVRYDDNDGQFDDATTWRVGAAYNLTDTTRVRASAGAGVKNPTFTELFGFFPGSFTGNPDLKPEKSTSYEVGLDQRAGPVDFSVTWFTAELEDEIFTVFNPDFTSSPANRTGESEREGLEIAANWQASESISVTAAFTDITSEDDQDQTEIRIPEQTASVAVNWQSPTKDRFRAGVALDYVGEQDDFFFTFPAQRVTLDNYTLVSATLNYPLTGRLAVTLRGQNIFDEEVVDVFGFNQPGSGFFAGLRLQ